MHLGSTPTASTAPRWAEDIVDVAREGARSELDYSVASLRYVDRVLGEIRDQDPPEGLMDSMLVEFGCYLGEVLVRCAGATWVDLDEGQRAGFGRGLGLRTPDGRLWDPIGAVVSWFARRSGQSAQAFVRTASVVAHR
ncbi:hypothetical protein GCM10010406_22920 [Streptomyces thermolineatus]|uniref:Uncharacterized protein n=1 Tax=Streptomyces thermolineatus TaxID=44033 RepID=A0ABN3LKS6_9ACTN